MRRGMDPDIRDTLESLKAEYDRVLPAAQRALKCFGQELSLVVGRCAFPMAQRIKTWESIARKFERLPHLPRSILCLQDLVGFRFIVLSPRDALRVCDAIHERYGVHGRSGDRIVDHEDTANRLDPSQFGYGSFHIVVRMWSEYCQAGGRWFPMVAEIQVRTVCQHLWADLSHTLQYKAKDKMSVAGQRALSLLAALLEGVDQQIEVTMEERLAYLKELDHAGSDDILTCDNIEPILRRLLPPDNKVRNERFVDLVTELKRFGIITKANLEQLIQNHRDAILQQEERDVKAAKRAQGDECNPAQRKRAKQGVHHSHVGLVQLALLQEFGDKWKEYRMRRGRGVVDRY